MHKIQRFERIRQHLRCLNTYRLSPSQSKLFSTHDKENSEENNNISETTLVGNDDVNEAISDNTIQDCTKTEDFSQTMIEPVQKEPTFAHLLRYSQFINLGDPKDKIVPGKIFNIVGNDLYIDFGWKFYCVCPNPTTSQQSYVKGAIVKLKVLDLEMASKFIGASQELTLLEANCILLGLWNSPGTPRRAEKFMKVHKLPEVSNIPQDSVRK